MKELHPLRVFLMKNNESVEDFAERTDLNKATVYLWLKGKSFPSQSNIVKVQEALNYEDPVTLYKEWKEWQNENAEEA